MTNEFKIKYLKINSNFVIGDIAVYLPTKIRIFI